MSIRFVLFVLLALEISSCSGKPENADTSIDKEVVPQTEKAEPRGYSSEYLLGKFNQKTDTSFALIPMKYCSKEGMYLRKETIAAFVKMYDAAKKEGVNLKIISATRNFNEQKSIWEAKWNGTRLVNGNNLAQTIKDPVERAKIILRYSSMPGTSRHHWGTDMDLNSLENAYFTTAEGKKTYEWLKKYAAHYGFCQPYSGKNETRPNGYEEEKWHWSYYPISKMLPDLYKQKVSYKDIHGFSGSEYAESLKVIDHYVLSVYGNCCE